MNVAAVILNYKRAPNIPIIIKALQDGKVIPNEIIVINNNPGSSPQVMGSTLIRCSRNFGCQVRHALGQVAGATHCLFVDDDLTVGPNTLYDFIAGHKELPDAILGHWGVRVNREDKNPYGSRIQISSVEKPTAVDIVLGRIHFCRVDKLAQAFILFNKVPEYPPTGSGMDDILLSLANRCYGHKNYVIPTGPLSRTCDLPDFDTGMYKRKGHYRMRDNATRLLLGTVC